MLTSACSAIDAVAKPVPPKHDASGTSDDPGRDAGAAIATPGSAPLPNSVDAGARNEAGARAARAEPSELDAGAAGASGDKSPPPHTPDEDAGASEPADAPRSCLVWRGVDTHDNMAPAGAVEGGSEILTGTATPAKQYVCRARPAGNTYAIPGKYVVGQGCYVPYRQDGKVMKVDVLDGLIDVLLPAAGCSFSWQTASITMLPRNVIDLGDPAGGGNYACRGYYNSVASSGIQIGAVLATQDDPPLNQCWFESFVGVVQPAEPSEFEVLVLDAR